MSAKKSSTLLLVLLGLAGTVGANQLIAGHGQATNSGTQLRYVGPAPVETTSSAAKQTPSRLPRASEIKLLPASLGQMSARTAAKPQLPASPVPTPKPAQKSSEDRLLGQSLLGGPRVASKPQPAAKPAVVKSAPRYEPRLAPPVTAHVASQASPSQDRYTQPNSAQPSSTQPNSAKPAPAVTTAIAASTLATPAAAKTPVAAKTKAPQFDPFVDDSETTTIVSDLPKTPAPATSAPQVVAAPTVVRSSSPVVSQPVVSKPATSKPAVISPVAKVERALAAVTPTVAPSPAKPVAHTSSNPASQSRYAINNAFPKLSLLDTAPAPAAATSTTSRTAPSAPAKPALSRVAAQVATTETKPAAPVEPADKVTKEQVSVAFVANPKPQQPEFQEPEFQAPELKKSESHRGEISGGVELARNETIETNAAYTTGGSVGSIADSTTVSGEYPSTTPYPDRAKIVFRPAVVDVNRKGRPVLRPEVQVASRQVPGGEGVSYVSDNAEQIPYVPGEGAYIQGESGEVIVPEEWAAPVVADPHGQYAQQCQTCEPRLGPCHTAALNVLAELNGPCGCEPRLGAERVIHAPSFIETTQPLNNFRLRLDTAYDYRAPDRAEYFWARTGDGRGPDLTPERTVDYQDIRAYLEMGGDAFSVGTDIPIRIVEPSLNENHAGLGDITITTKTKFLDGKHWQLTNLFRVYIPSGDADKGLGTGHTSLEPGFAWRYKWSDVTYFHGDLKYWFPLGGDNLFEGEVLSYGIGMSHVWSETDCWAVIPTFEIVGYSFIGGLYTDSFLGTPVVVPVDSDGIMNIHPGVRFVRDKGSDCGVQELGLFSGFAVSEDNLYEEILRVELRWSW